MNAPDYHSLIDAEMWAYIQKVDACYPADAVDLDIAGQRAVYDAMCRVFYQGRPDGIAVKDFTSGGVPCRLYETGQSDTTVIYYHGGGFVVGGLDSHDDVCAEICARTGYRVISVDYGLAPDVIYPGCFNDAWAAFESIAVAPKVGRIVLCGDSAGGNLAAAVSHRARRTHVGRIAAQVLIYPGLGGDWGAESYVTHADAPHLTTKDMKFYMTIRTGGATPPVGDPHYAPLQDSDFSGLPATVCITAQCDPLASDGGAYAQAILAAGGRAHWSNVPGMVHGCLRARAMSARAAGFFDEVVGAVEVLGREEWPYRR